MQWVGTQCIPAKNKLISAEERGGKAQLKNEKSTNKILTFNRSGAFTLLCIFRFAAGLILEEVTVAASAVALESKSNYSPAHLSLLSLTFLGRLLRFFSSSSPTAFAVSLSIIGAKVPSLVWSTLCGRCMQESSDIYRCLPL